MDWRARLPDGVGQVESTADGFQASVSLPVDDDGYFGRACPTCETPFKMSHREYRALPEDIELTCPYCGHRAEHSEFMTPEQRARVRAAAEALAEQYVHQQVREMFEGVFGRGRRRPPRAASGGFGISLDVSYTPGSPPPLRALPPVIEAGVRRTIACPACQNHYAVYGASAFCPVCGPRPALDTVCDAIAAARAALGIEDTLSEDQREQMRAAGVFERFAADALTSSVTLFEVFASEVFSQRVAEAERLTKGRGSVFQRLEDAAALFLLHAGIDLPALAGPARWKRLGDAFARRHVLVHRNGRVDERFLEQVTGSGLRVGQRLVTTRRQAEGVLDDLEALIRAMAVS